MTNPGAAIKVLITYALCIPLAITVGYLLTDPLADYGTTGTFGLIALLLLLPILLKWHYPIMLFALASPIYCFFLKGNPPLGQVAVLLSFGIAVVERAMNSERRFISPAVMVWPLVFTVAMAYMTADLTGGIGLKSLGGGADGSVGGGKKYIAIFIGAAAFFALTSRVVTKKQRNWYLAFYFLPGVLQIFGDLAQYLPSPVNYITYLIPASYNPNMIVGFSPAVARFGSFAGAAGAVATYMLAKYGLRGIFQINRPFRFLLFICMFLLTLVGGFRVTLLTFMVVGTLMFFLEGLHRTKMLPPAILGGLVCMGLLIPFANKLPENFQRALTVVPFLKLDNAAVMDAEGSKEWRLNIWRDTWPKVPQYLLVGKGYALTAEDYDLMGSGQFAGGVDAAMDRSNEGLAVSSDYHSGPLSTLIPFGLWGAISVIWLLAAGLFICYRNFRYSDPELRVVNAFFLASFIWHTVSFFTVFGAYQDEPMSIARVVGFSVALNWGIRKAAPRPVAAAQAPAKRRLLPTRPLPA